MNYIVYDTEFSQPQPKLYNPNSRFKPNPISPFEIIEIGAVKLDERLQMVDDFSRLIKPVIYKRLSPIVVRKTGINKNELNNGEPFKKVMKDFKDWIGDDFILCTWSNNDVRILRRNCIYHKISCEWTARYYDVQKHCTKVLGLPKHQAVGLKKALDMLDIKVEGKLHRALEDAKYTAMVLMKVYSKEMKEDIEQGL